jgi:hypothetical protein
MRPRLEGSFAGELRCMRAIHKVVVADMLTRMT